MAIKDGKKIPRVVLKRLNAKGEIEDIDTVDYFRGRTVLLFGTPGAFTPTCAQKHLPDYIGQAEAIKASGVDEIVCVAVNDPYVMKQWADAARAEGKVTMLSDGNAKFTKALGLGMDIACYGMGYRCKRFSMIVENGIVRNLQVEKSIDDVGVTGAQACMVRY